MIVTLGQTDNFTIEYQDNFPDARRRAQALRNSCESEFAMLMQWFAVIKHPDGTEAFGPSNRVTLQVETASFANNYGYHRDGTTKVIMNPFDTQHFPAPGEDVNQADADDAVLGLFVAEIVEVLMSYHNTRSLPGFQAWNPVGSDGERPPEFVQLCSIQRATTTFFVGEASTRGSNRKPPPINATTGSRKPRHPTRILTASGVRSFSFIICIRSSVSACSRSSARDPRPSKRPIIYSPG